jgi:hypothetical protein
MSRILGAIFLMFAASTISAQVQGPFAQPTAPQVHITNGLIHATVYTPDSEKGFYRGTRFDWAGVIGHLEYAGHNYYGPWFTKTDPNVFDFIYKGDDIVASPCSAAVGPVEEFFTNDKALGFDQAAPGATFIKIGVGVLRRPDSKDYSSYIQYTIVDPGKRTTHATADSVEFTQDVTDPTSGYGYSYKKTIRLVPGKPQMLISHSLTNTGKLPIESNVFDHNFLSLDKLPIGPDLRITLPFKLGIEKPIHGDLGVIEGDSIIYRKQLEGHQSFANVITGFGPTPADYNVKIENARAHAGLSIIGDRPLHSLELWSIRSVVAVEPFIHIAIQPGQTFTWSYTYTYFTLP